MTAGRFQAMTGLSAKALRLYAERAIIAPDTVDPRSGYRLYSSAQMRHGMLADLLRRAQVPLSELVDAADFSFTRWRQQLALKRHLEDFHLEVAERVARFRVEEVSAQTRHADETSWVGAVVSLALPDDVDGRAETFSTLASELPSLERALAAALAESGPGRRGSSWTGVPEGLARGGDHMLLAHDVAEPIDGVTRRRLARIIGEAVGREVTVVAGTLPARAEVTFSPAPGTDRTPVWEAAWGYVQALAFADHVARRGLTPLRTTARLVTRGGVFASNGNGDGDGEPRSVFDVRMPPAG